MARPIPALALALTFVAAPALAQAPYTDHYGTWAFTGLGTPAGPADAGPAAGLASVLLRLDDGTGFTVFVFGLDPGTLRALPYQAARPPPLAFECYTDLQSGNLVLRGEQTQVAGSCVQSLEAVDGALRLVVRFAGYQVPVRGMGVYCVEAAPADCGA